jgi:phage host-nuclease inhibitor protein Gam
MAKKPKKLKAPAQTYVCQSLDDTQACIKSIGDMQREHLRITADLNDAIGNLTQAVAGDLQTLVEGIQLRQAGVQTWCEANREKLCGKGKTANLVTGEVTWRNRPPSVTVKGEEAVIAYLKLAGLTAFIRSKESVNKEAMLNEKDKAKGIPGITLVSELEDFSITPFEIETAVEAV